MLSRIAMISFVFLGLVLVVPQPASAQQTLNFSVSTNAADAVDANIGDGICLTVNATCTLRAAIQEANAAPNKLAFIQVNNAGTIALTIDGANENAAATGDLDVTGNAFISNGAIINASALDDRAFHVYNGGRLTISDSDLTNSTTVSGQNGGGVFVTGVGSTLTLQFMTLKNSVAVAGRGGGVSIENGAFASIQQVSIDTNSAGLEGGGIYVSNAGLDLFNTTVIANTASGNGKGAGIAVNNDSDDNTIDDALKYVSINNATFHSNIIPSGGLGGGLVNLNDIAPAVKNSIFAANSATTGNQCGFAASATAAILSLGYNIITNTTGCTGSTIVDITTAPTLTLFTGSNGRHFKPTTTSSSAVDAASAVSCASTDAVSSPRPQGTGCDIGAIELAVGFPASVFSSVQVSLNQWADVTVSDYDERFWGEIDVLAEAYINDTLVDSETLTLEEISNQDGVFNGQILVEFTSVALPEDGVIGMIGEGKVIFSYSDSPNGATEGGVSLRASATQVMGLQSDLMDNPSFESGLSEWTASGLSGDLRRCNKPGKVFAIDGNCMFEMTGTTGALTQNVDLPLSSGFDDDLMLEILVNSSAARPGVVATVTAKYKGGLGKDKCSINLLAGTNSGAGGYELYQCELEIEEDFDQVKKITVSISVPGGATVRFDRVSLFAITPRSRAAATESAQGDVLPPPQIPDGFRR